MNRTVKRCLPRHTSKISLIEIRISILTGKSLTGASFRSVAGLMVRIDNFVAGHTEEATPTVWTDRVVHHQWLKPRLAT
jgi:hypothetical protein